MTIAQHHRQTGLERSALDEVLRTGTLTDSHLTVLRWLVWLPLLSREELERVVSVQGQNKNAQMLWRYLNRLASLHLVEHVVFNESGWPRNHHRYYVTDLGLYTLAALNTRPISVSKIATSYPVMRADLFARLARPRVHLALSSLVTRLIADNLPGYRVSSYQQPYRESYTDLEGKKHTVVFDAAFLIQTPKGAQHAFYVHVDQQEHMLSQREVNACVLKLLALRQSTHLAHETMPHFLLLSSQERFPFWAEHLNRMTVPQGIALLNVSKPVAVREHMDLSCSVADTADLRKGGLASIWTPCHALIEQDGTVQTDTQTGIHSLLERVASRRLTERFSHYFSFQHALLLRDTGLLTRRSPILTRYVEDALCSDAAPFLKKATPQDGVPKEEEGPSTRELSDHLAECFYGAPEDRLFMSALLTLALSEQQKEIIAHLARHPYLELSDLLPLLGYQDERLLARQMMPLIRLNLVDIYPWRKAPTWRECERYYLLEPALRFLAERHGLSPAYYLEPSYADKQRRESNAQLVGEEKKALPSISPLSRKVTWVQRGAWGLCKEDGKAMPHTSGLYRCVRAILRVSSLSDAYEVRYWKSAREAQRLFSDPIDGLSNKIRPDAELLYTTRGTTSARSVLLEYDRATTNLTQLRDKFLCYIEYQQATRSTLPTILVITQNERSKRKIQRAMDGAKALEVSILVVLEEDILQEGLLPVLFQLR